MANAIYPKFKEAVLQHLTNSNLSSGTVKAALVDTGVYTYNSAHDFLDDVTGRVGTDQTLTSKTFVNGVFDAANSVFPSVTGASVEAIIIYVDTGSAATSRLVAYIDTGIGGFPLTPDGNNINVNWDAAGIFTL
jgi:hypothetical protein